MDSLLFKLHCEKGISVFLLCFKYKRLYQSTREDTSSKDSKLVEQIFILINKVPKTFSLSRELLMKIGITWWCQNVDWCFQKHNGLGGYYIAN